VRFLKNPFSSFNRRKDASRFDPGPHTSARQDPELTSAYEMGSLSVESFAADLDKLIKRFSPVAEGYLEIVQGRYNDCLSPTDAPPIIAASIEYKIFLKNVAELRSKMMGEITSVLTAWLDVAHQLEMRDEFIQLIRVKVDNFCRDLSETGWQRLLDMAHALKRADDQWRAAHPELSAKFPSEAA
jgi:hypothetical protein